jgi:hypothetical protein
VFGEPGHELGADEPGSADDDDLHVMPFACVDGESGSNASRPVAR